MSEIIRTNPDTVDLTGAQELYIIGVPTTAQAIIDGRPWSSVQDLATIQGINSDMIAGWDITV